MGRRQKIKINSKEPSVCSSMETTVTETQRGRVELKGGPHNAQIK